MLTMMKPLATLTLIGCFAAACAGDERDNAATRLHQTLVEANHKLDAWVNKDTVVTHEMQRDVMDPVGEATMAYALEIEAMGDDLEYGETNRDVFVAISREYFKLADTLDITVSDSYSDASDECDCTDSGECVTPTPTPIEETAAEPIIGEVSYKTICTGAAQGAYVGCVALCWKKCALNAKKRAICIAACTAALATAMSACDSLDEPWSN